MTDPTALENWVFPAGSTARDGWDTAVEPDGTRWRHTGLLVTDLAAGETRVIVTGDREYLVVPLAGGCQIDVHGTDRGAEATASTDGDSVDGTGTLTLVGRAGVFAGPTDIGYLPPGRTATVTATGPARIALPCAVVPEGRSTPQAHRVDAAEIPVELRGAGAASREVRNFGTPGTLDAAAIIACEVLTPAGNWSSWPPHKHDETIPGRESELEEIYYFELTPTEGAPAGAAPMGYQRVYGTPDRPVDVLAEVRDRDVVLIPHGWHGPSTAPPGYHLYYLNVMAGPGPERVWLITDDPAHGWVRTEWDRQTVDPRLPFGGTL